MAAQPAPRFEETATLPAQGVILPFRHRSVRQPSDRDMEQAIRQATGLLVAGHIAEATVRFHELAAAARQWRLSERRAAWQLPAWVGEVVCHALHGEWLAAEMAACEHLAELPVDELPNVYIEAAAITSEMLAGVPDARQAALMASGPVERRRFPRNMPAPADGVPDPARDYSYALVSAIRFRVGGD